MKIDMHVAIYHCTRMVRTLVSLCVVVFQLSTFSFYYLLLPLPPFRTHHLTPSQTHPFTYPLCRYISSPLQTISKVPHTCVLKMLPKCTYLVVQHVAIWNHTSGSLYVIMFTLYIATYVVYVHSYIVYMYIM